MHSADIVELNVGGVPYTTTTQTLCGAVEPHSMLARIVQCGIPSRRDATGRIFIDRDGVRFRAVLNYLRSASIHCTHDRTALRELAEEAEYFGMVGLVKMTSDELMRIELEEELGSMTSAPRDEQRGFDAIFHSSPISSQESIPSESNRGLRDPVVRSLDFGAPFADTYSAPDHDTPLESARSVLKPPLIEHIFTLDADF